MDGRVKRKEARTECFLLDISIGKITKKYLMFQIACAKIPNRLNTINIVEKGYECVRYQKMLTVEHYTSFRESRSPAVSLLKNKVGIEFPTGAASVNFQ